MAYIRILWAWATSIGTSHRKVGEKKHRSRGFFDAGLVWRMVSSCFGRAETEWVQCQLDMVNPRRHGTWRCPELGVSLKSSISI